MMPACARSCVRSWREMNNPTWFLTRRVCILIEEQSKAESAECRKSGSQERQPGRGQHSRLPLGKNFTDREGTRTSWAKGARRAIDWSDLGMMSLFAGSCRWLGEALGKHGWGQQCGWSTEEPITVPSSLLSHIMELENWNTSFPCNYAWAARAKESQEECKLMKVVGKPLKSRQLVLACSSWASSPHFFLLQSTGHYLWKQQPSWQCETLQEWGYVCGMAEEKASNLLLPQWHHLAAVSSTSPHALCMEKKIPIWVKSRLVRFSLAHS